MTASELTPSPAAESVQLPGVGSVTLTPLDQLRRARQAEQAASRELSVRAASITAVVEERLADAGAVLVPQRSLWPVPVELEATVQHATALVAQMAGIDQQRQEQAPAAEHGIFRRISAWRQDRRLRSARDAASRELHAILVQVATSALAGGAASPEAMPILDEVRHLQAEAADVRLQSDAHTEHVSAIQQEIALCDESFRTMGFDALYAAAYLVS